MRWSCLVLVLLFVFASTSAADPTDITQKEVL